MKTFIFENNYNVDSSDKLCWFTVAESVSVNSGKPFFLPDFDTSYTAYPCVAIKFAKLGKSISKEFAPRYYVAAAPAFMIIADNLRASLLSRNLPPDAAMNFDKAFQLGEFVELDNCIRPFTMKIVVNGKEVAIWEETKINVPLDNLVEMISSYNTIKVGDVILPALSKDGIKLESGMIVEGILLAEHHSAEISFHIK